MSTLLLAALLASASAETPDTLSWETDPLVIVRRVPLQWPASVSREGAEDVACDATVTIDPHGAPRQVGVSTCPESFIAETQVALLQWRWTQYRLSVDRRVTLRVRFRGLPEASAAVVEDTALPR